MAASSVDWDLLRVFLALMRANTLREAAAALGTSHPTVRRKLHTLETQLGDSRCVQRMKLLVTVLKNKEFRASTDGLDPCTPAQGAWSHTPIAGFSPLLRWLIGEGHIQSG